MFSRCISTQKHASRRIYGLKSICERKRGGAPIYPSRRVTAAPVRVNAASVRAGARRPASFLPDPKPTDAGSPSPRSNLTLHSQKNRKALASVQEETPSPKKKSKTNAWTLAPIPTVCPARSCKDPIHNPVPPAIISLFRQRQALIDTNGPAAAGHDELTQQICTVLRLEHERSESLAHAKSAGWPVNIDFDNLPARIIPLVYELEQLCSDSIFLNKSPIWRTFLHLIDYRVWAFSRSSSRFVSANLGSGYFGPKGRAIMQATIKALEADGEDDAIENRLFATHSALTDTPQNWDEFEDDSNLISPAKFTKFILIPHLAASLIAQDLESTLREAIDILEASEQFGLFFNADPPERVDIILSPIHSQQAPPRTQSQAFAAKAKEDNARGLSATCENFQAPPKTKPKNAQPVEKPQPMPAEKEKKSKGRPAAEEKETKLMPAKQPQVLPRLPFYYLVLISALSQTKRCPKAKHPRPPKARPNHCSRSQPQKPEPEPEPERRRTRQTARKW
ncbi:hypothetical protein C8F04DRAFT_1187930 [Mycena alexandri]|uniref:Restriction of telomere capping protein 4 n=1 Tax=Mycena alexandri TaxID=1745969 RepID=A0AAD6SJG2_9AGAR|nr:hypothetical protein C8F04DRAFT_1187930 [Mycena alexandri]